MGRDRSRSMSSSSSGRGVQSSTWDGESGYRVHVSDLAAGVSRKEIERAFTKYGPINEVWVATNPPCFAFINFKHRSDAEKAIREVDGKVLGSTRVGASWARTRTYGGRSRGSRGAPYGSYRNSGGSRRRSRSRSGSDSRHKRRRHSRSRSRDRHRHRSASPRDRKRSGRTTDEKNGNDERKDDKPKSKKTQSTSRSRSRSTPRKESPNDDKRRSPSHDPSINAENTNSPSPARADENNTYDRSPLAAGDE
jgi:arginine/serine-rich splicing factor 7